MIEEILGHVRRIAQEGDGAGIYTRLNPANDSATFGSMRAAAATMNTPRGMTAEQVDQIEELMAGNKIPPEKMAEYARLIGTAAGPARDK